MLGTAVGDLEYRGRAALIGSSVGQRAASAYEIVRRMETARYRIVQVDARTRLGFSGPSDGVASSYARLWTHIFHKLLENSSRRALSRERWAEFVARAHRLLNAKEALSRDEGAFIRSVPVIMHGKTSSSVLRDALGRYGDGIRTPELVAAIAPVIRSLSRDVLIVIHEAQQFEATRDIASVLFSTDESGGAPDLCLLVTAERRHGFSFFEEASSTTVHNLDAARTALQSELPRPPGLSSVTEKHISALSPAAPSPPGTPASHAPIVPGTGALQATARLKPILDARARQSPLAIMLEPVDQVLTRRIVPGAGLPVLRPGKYRLRCAASFAAADGVYLLLVEHDRKQGDWILVNAIPDAALPLDQLKPASGVHTPAFLIQSSGGVCDLYAIASTVGFGAQLHAFVDAAAEYGEEGTFNGHMLDDFSEAVLDLLESDTDGHLATARFTYRVEA